MAALTGLGVPAAAATRAGPSVAAGMAVAGHLPGRIAGIAVSAVRDGFLTGMRHGSLVAAAAAAAAALAALAFLPARVRPAPAAAHAAEALVPTLAGQGEVR